MKTTVPIGDQKPDQKSSDTEKNSFAAEKNIGGLVLKYRKRDYKMGKRYGGKKIGRVFIAAEQKGKEVF